MSRVKSNKPQITKCSLGQVTEGRTKTGSTQFNVIKSGTAASLKIRFGSVLVEASAPSKTAAKRNIEAGSVAMGRVARVLARPGVKVELGRDVPLYKADPSRAGYLIRTLKGTQQSGKIVDGKFKPV
jgi:hypothetical protein